MGLYRFTPSGDAINRVNIQVTHRLSVKDLAKILAHSFARYGADLDNGVHAFTSDDLTGQNISAGELDRTVRRHLKTSGEMSLSYESDEIYRWAIWQIERITGEAFQD